MVLLKASQVTRQDAWPVRAKQRLSGTKNIRFGLIIHTKSVLLKHRGAHLPDVQVAHAISAEHGSHLPRIPPNDFTEEFDRGTRSFRPPLDHAQLSEVGAGVTGQGLPVYEVKPAKFTGSV